MSALGWIWLFVLIGATLIFFLILYLIRHRIRQKYNQKHGNKNRNIFPQMVQQLKTAGKPDFWLSEISRYDELKSKVEKLDRTEEKEQ